MSATCFYGGCSQANKFLGLPPENVYEENIERVIEKETGVQIDLTPNSPESEDVHSCDRFKFKLS
jgi:hypothetical protein